MAASDTLSILAPAIWACNVCLVVYGVALKWVRTGKRSLHFRTRWDQADAAQNLVSALHAVLGFALAVKGYALSPIISSAYSPVLMRHWGIDLGFTLSVQMSAVGSGGGVRPHIGVSTFDSQRTILQ